MTPSEDISGREFGNLVVLEYIGVTPTKQRMWRAVCKCSNEVIVRSRELLAGDTKSCGCLKAEATRARNRRQAKHQRSRSPEYRSWRSAKDRCLNPKSKDWNNYGGRGIVMDKEWANDFSLFFAELGVRPAGMSLERKDVNLGYVPGNCKWATPTEQAANRRSTRLVQGVPAAVLAKHEGVTPAAIYKRIKRGVYGNS